MPTNLNRLSILFVNYTYIAWPWQHENNFIQVFLSVPGCRTCMCKRANTSLYFTEKRHKIEITDFSILGPSQTKFLVTPVSTCYYVIFLPFGIPPALRYPCFPWLLSVMESNTHGNTQPLSTNTSSTSILSKNIRVLLYWTRVLKYR